MSRSFIILLFWVFLVSILNKTPSPHVTFNVYCASNCGGNLPGPQSNMFWWSSSCHIHAISLFYPLDVNGRPFFLFFLRRDSVRLRDPESPAPRKDGRAQQLRENNVLALDTETGGRGRTTRAEAAGHGPVPVRGTRLGRLRPETGSPWPWKEPCGDGQTKRRALTLPCR